MLKINKTIFSVAIVMMLVILSLGTSYAYLTEDLNESVSLQVLTGNKGSMMLGYQGNTDTVGFSKILPSSEVIVAKKFSITGTNKYNDDIMRYNLSLLVEYNDFEASDIYFVLGGQVDGNGEITYQADVNKKHYINRVLDSPLKIDLGTGYFKNSKEETHTYMLSFYYPKTIYNQNRNDRSLSAKIIFTNLNY